MIAGGGKQVSLARGQPTQERQEFYSFTTQILYFSHTNNPIPTLTRTNSDKHLTWKFLNKIREEYAASLL